MKNLIFDTGSKLIIFMCKGCTKCSKEHYTKPFDYNRSKTFLKLKKTNIFTTEISIQQNNQNKGNKRAT